MRRSIGDGRGAPEMENPRGHYAASLRARPAPVVRGSSRRIMIMRYRPANIRVINRRDRHLDRLRCCVSTEKEHMEESANLTRSFHISVRLQPDLSHGRNNAWKFAVV